MILSTAYLPNIQYISKFTSDQPLIEAHENFTKQSFRNRAEIMTADGIRPLIVPIVWTHDQKMPVKDVRIDNSTPWQRSHWRTITAAYTSSPYFEHFSEHLSPYYTHDYTYLWDLNCDLTRKILEILRISHPLRFTSEYQIDLDNDFRNSISPKPRLQQPDPTFTPPHYYQVFSDRQPFAQNLSIIDYLFCEGNKLNLGNQ